MLKSIVGALVMLLFVVPVVNAPPLSVKDIDWQFYQYGSVSVPDDVSVFHQGHRSAPAGVASVDGYSHEGASWESAALLLWNESSSLESYSLSVDFSILATALVDPGNPEGNAQAGGGLSLLGAQFTVNETVQASLETSAASRNFYYGGDDDLDWTSTFLMNPGEYGFVYDNLFGIDAEATAWGSPGFASAAASHYFNFTFKKVPVPVPAPGVFLLFGAGLLGIAAVRGRGPLWPPRFSTGGKLPSGR